MEILGHAITLTQEPERSIRSQDFVKLFSKVRLVTTGRMDVHDKP